MNDERNRKKEKQRKFLWKIENRPTQMPMMKKRKKKKKPKFELQKNNLWEIKTEKKKPERKFIIIFNDGLH